MATKRKPAAISEIEKALAPKRKTRRKRVSDDARKSITTTLRMTAESRDKLEDLKTRSRVSMAELIRRAVNVLDLMLDADQQGGYIALHHKDGSFERMRFL